MSSSFQTPQDLLAYNSAHRVLICRQCQYAIQKSAISSHLLRHKIYREERQRLLSYIADLGLLDPEDVICPVPGSPAIEGLSVIPGYCCTSPGCGSLCASIKRMKRHQSEMHTKIDLANVEAYARPVKMQTFFRGTKLRYFEVTGIGTEDVSVVGSSEASPEGHENIDPKDTDGRNSSIGYASSGMIDRSPSPRTASLSGSARSSGQAPDLNLEAMTYFRHYLTTTSASLPAPYDQPQAWSTIVVDYALKHQWLMYGLLALSAYHLVITCPDAEDQETHIANGNQYASEFSNGISLELVRQQIYCGTDMSAIGDRIHQLLKCATWAVQHSTSDIDRCDSQITVSLLDPLLETLGHLARWSFIPKSDIPDQELVFSRAKMILESYDEDTTNLDLAYLRLLNSLKTLPAQLSNALGRPDRVQEVLVTLVATSSLVVCCEMTFASDSKEAMWHGIVGWVAMLPQKFYDMLKADNPAALVLLTYWSALVSRAERAASWFMCGLADRIIREVHGRLTNDQSGLRGLVQQFVS